MVSERVCLNCGAVLGKRQKNYCKKECYYEHLNNTGLRRGINNPNYKEGSVVHRRCAYCNDVFEIHKSMLKHQKGVFCSISCANNYRMYNGVRTVMDTCVKCGAEFYNIIGHGDYCSLECEGIDVDMIDIDNTCRVCGFVVRGKEWGSGKFCSEKCYHRSQKNGVIKGMCDICMGAFDISITKLVNEGSICCDNCYGMMNSNTNEYILHDVTCERCGLLFKTYLNNRRYCSFNCFNKFNYNE